MSDGERIFQNGKFVQYDTSGETLPTLMVGRMGEMQMT